MLPGNERDSTAFRAALEVARAAQLRYALYRRIRLTGHSRGGEDPRDTRGHERTRDDKRWPEKRERTKRTRDGPR